MDIVTNEMFFGIVLSLVAFEIGLLIYRKTNIPIFNPLLISIALVTGFLLVFHIDFSVYNKGGQFINMFLGPATVVLAVPLYKQLELLKKHATAILIGILLGSLIGICSVVLLSYLFGLNAELIRSLLPKSVTTPIGMEVSSQLQGIVPITVLAIIISGISGAVLGPIICKLFRITDSVAVGVAIGTSSHAVGTSKAFEMGETEGAMSSLSVGIAGIMTVFLAPLIYTFAQYVHTFIKVIS